MNEDDTVRENLITLLDFNSSESPHVPYQRDQSGTIHLINVHELQEFNEERLIAIADLLGMSDLYLDD